MASETVYDARSIASYLLNRAADRGLDALQVMKLTYIAHGFALASLNKVLIDDDVEAWKYGPVIRRLYYAIPAGSQSFKALIQPTQPANLIGEDRDLVDAVFEKYGQLSGLHLSTLTHRPGSPWHQTRAIYGQNAVIPKDLIQKHYAGILAAWRDAAATNRPYSPDAL